MRNSYVPLVRIEMQFVLQSVCLFFSLFLSGGSISILHSLCVLGKPLSLLAPQVFSAKVIELIVDSAIDRYDPEEDDDCISIYETIYYNPVAVLYLLSATQHYNINKRYLTNILLPHSMICIYHIRHNMRNKRPGHLQNYSN